MSVERELRHLALVLRNPHIVLGDLADVVEQGIHRNLRLSKNTGDARPPDLNPITRGEAAPESAMEPLSDFTLRQRRKEGIVGSKPLVATGRFARELGKHSEKRGRSVKVGPKTAYAKRIAFKQSGTFDTGIKSDITRSDIPARLPIGYGKRERDQVKDTLRRMFRIGRATRSTTRVDIRL